MTPTKQQRAAAKRIGRNVRDYSPMSMNIFYTESNGKIGWFWSIVDFVNEPPIRAWKWNAPFDTEDEADRDLNATVRAFLGTQCEITRGGTMPESLASH